MAASAYYDLTQQVYISYFGRPADPRGLEAFATGLSNANAPTTIGELNTAYKTNPAIKSLVDSFATSTESATLYGSADTDTFINSIFLNVLNRPAKLEGLNFWNTEISSGRVTKAGAALAIMAGAYANTTAQGLSDQAVINNKVAVANSFTTGIDTVEELIAYKGAAAANTARNMLHNVVETTTVTGFQATVDATLTNLVNQVANATGQTFNLTLSTDAVTGTAGNDTIVANYDVQNGAHTVSGLDNIDGGNGTDTLAVRRGNGYYLRNSLTSGVADRVVTYGNPSD
ncbi:MAG: DUF4214 domain-containing protein, partial [Gammaproteobacteria bacterium]